MAVSIISTTNPNADSDSTDQSRRKEQAQRVSLAAKKAAAVQEDGPDLPGLLPRPADHACACAASGLVPSVDRVQVLRAGARGGT